MYFYIKYRENNDQTVRITDFFLPLIYAFISYKYPPISKDYAERIIFEGKKIDTTKNLSKKLIEKMVGKVDEFNKLLKKSSPEFSMSVPGFRITWRKLNDDMKIIDTVEIPTATIAILKTYNFPGTITGNSITSQNNLRAYPGLILNNKQFTHLENFLINIIKKLKLTVRHEQTFNYENNLSGTIIRYFDYETDSFVFTARNLFLSDEIQKRINLYSDPIIKKLVHGKPIIVTWTEAKLYAEYYMVNFLNAFYQIAKIPLHYYNTNENLYSVEIVKLFQNMEKEELIYIKNIKAPSLKVFLSKHCNNIKVEQCYYDENLLVSYLPANSKNKNITCFDNIQNECIIEKKLFNEFCEFLQTCEDHMKKNYSDRPEICLENHYLRLIINKIDIDLYFLTAISIKRLNKQNNEIRLNIGVTYHSTIIFKYFNKNMYISRGSYVSRDVLNTIKAKMKRDHANQIFFTREYTTKENTGMFKIKYLRFYDNNVPKYKIKEIHALGYKKLSLDYLSDQKSCYKMGIYLYFGNGEYFKIGDILSEDQETKLTHRMQYAGKLLHDLNRKNKSTSLLVGNFKIEFLKTGNIYQIKKIEIDSYDSSLPETPFIIYEEGRYLIDFSLITKIPVGKYGEGDVLDPNQYKILKNYKI